MEGKKTPEEYLERNSFGRLNEEEKVTLKVANKAICLTRQENQDKLKEIRDKIYKLKELPVDKFNPIDEMIVILNQYIDGK